MTADRPPLRILVVATKLPYPPVDGGRLLLWESARALAERGHRLTLVAPGAAPAPDLAHQPFERIHTVAARRVGVPRAVLNSAVTGRPVAIERHADDRVRRQVDALLARQPFDLVHVEQVHAMSNLPADRAGIPTVMRCQNAESELWAMLARARPYLRAVASWQARQMRRFESHAVRSVELAMAISREDRATLADAAGITPDALPVVRAPFAARLPASDDALPGDPPVLLLDSRWTPNRDGTDWFLDHVLQPLRDRLPGSVVHVFGDRRTQPATDGLMFHAAPADSREVFAANGVLAVPLRIASGVRMKILEAWSRGVPVVATREACKGLDVADGEGVLMASSAADFAAAVERLHTAEDERSRLVEAGRRVLVERHDPARIAEQLESLYVGVVERHGG